MSKFFSIDYLAGEFVLFGFSHIAALAITVLLNVGMVVWQRRVKSERARMGFRYALAALLILQEISLNLWRLSTGTWAIGESLPLHLCGISVILSAIMLVNDSYFLYELTYFWGFGGAIQAMLTPDMTYAFPHYRFFQVFVSHGAIITATVYMTFVVRYRPTLKSLWKCFWITNGYLILIALVNLLIGGNYLFICHKPPTPSLIDALGPWPWYVLSLEGVGLAFFVIYYLPFGIRDLIDTRRKRATT